jgi:thiosulfate/3-mercaptopyruvate sulfurtransferase
VDAGDEPRYDVKNNHTQGGATGMANGAQRWLVETAWLASHLDTPGLVILDGSMHLPTAKRNARAEYMAEHIPGALFFDIDDIADDTSPLPHMLPPPAKFASRMKKMGIGDGMHIVAYDSEGLYSAARVWWMFRAMGHEEVRILNGGLKKWKAEGRPLEDGEPRRRSERHFTAMLNAGLVRDVGDIKGLLASRAAQIVDARASVRFEGTAPEPRQGLRSGHIPGSRNVPFASLIGADGTLKDEAELAAIFARAGVDIAKPVVASCGSGVTAGVVALALAILGRADAAVYDGSWTEWGADPSLPIETGPAR